MYWFKLHRSDLTSHKLASLSDQELGVWVRLMSYCTAEENGGVINCAGWSQNQWLAITGVSKKLVEKYADRSAIVVRLSDNLFRVKFYPESDQKEIEHIREIKKNAANARWHPVDADNTAPRSEVHLINNQDDTKPSNPPNPPPNSDASAMQVHSSCNAGAMHHIDAAALQMHCSCSDLRDKSTEYRSTEERENEPLDVQAQPVPKEVSLSLAAPVSVMEREPDTFQRKGFHGPPRKEEVEAWADEKKIPRDWALYQWTRTTINHRWFMGGKLVNWQVNWALFWEEDRPIWLRRHGKKNLAEQSEGGEKRRDFLFSSTIRREGGSR